MVNEKWMVESILWLLEHQGEGGTTNYNALTNKPQINGVTLQGNVSLETLDIASLEALEKKADKAEDSPLEVVLGRDDAGLYMEI